MFKNTLLKKYVLNYIHRVIPDIDLSKLNFCTASNNSPEGIYVYLHKKQYYFVFVEKGEIREKQNFTTKQELLVNILDTVLFDYAMDYAIKNAVKGNDFRRTLFNKEIELHSKFGNDFADRKKEEVRKTLEKNPYVDE